MKYRKKPLVIEAVQWQPGTYVAGVFVDCAKVGIQRADCPLGEPHVHTLEGPLRVSPGDWIITGVAGEKYPCKPEIFEHTYEPEDAAEAKDNIALDKLINAERSLVETLRAYPRGQGDEDRPWMPRSPSASTGMSAIESRLAVEP